MSSVSGRPKGKARKKAREQQAALAANASRSDTPVQSNTDVTPNDQRSSVSSAQSPPLEPSRPSSSTGKNSRAQPHRASPGASTKTAPASARDILPNTIKIALDRLAQSFKDNASPLASTPLLSRFAYFIQQDRQKSRIRRQQSKKEVERMAERKQKLDNEIEAQVKHQKRMIKDFQSMRMDSGSEEAHQGDQADATTDRTLAVFENINVTLMIPQPAKRNPNSSSEKKASKVPEDGPSTGSEKRRRKGTKRRKPQAVETANPKASSSATGPKCEDASSEDSSDDTDVVAAFLPFVMAFQKAAELRIRNRTTEGALQIQELLREAHRSWRESRSKPHPSSQRTYEIIDVVLALPHILQSYENAQTQVVRQHLSKMTLMDPASILPDLRIKDPDSSYRNVITVSCDSLAAVLGIILTLPPSVTGDQVEEWVMDSFYSKKWNRHDGTQIGDGDLHFTYMLLAYGWPSINI